ncbi:hypothetical protein GCM10009715_15160 [Paeniglutamicibacter psychrophenolicus]|uniref:DUF308 domain-containing protein n=1 Tax=Paeniglutamicibacter psychrophenolicus TaxID=257454 RepID=A0ABS4WC28_9MICC|nr:hypothetical protein [Paeniglutamicibacter psychrophenolicus]MBP2373760.1 hypothetical protein [Paeniglutamicibacter psychrophenolicus]
MDKVHTKAEGSTRGRTPKAVLGPLTTRDGFVILGGVLVLVGSLVPIPWTKTVSVNMWIFPGLPFHLLVSLLLPLLVAAGFTWRRLTGRTRVRIGSLSLDQAGSVVSLFAAAYFFNSYVASMSPAYLIGLIGALAMIAGTTLASYLGAFRRDFVPGGETVLGSDVLASAPPAAKPSAATASTESESFGASSAGAPATSATSTSHAANRPGMPVTGKDEVRREVAPVAVPAQDANASASASASAAASSAASAPVTASATGATAGATDSAANKTDHAPFTKDADQVSASGSNSSDTDAPEPDKNTPPESAKEASVVDEARAEESESVPESGTAKSAEPSEAADAAQATEAGPKPSTGNNEDPDAEAEPGTSDGKAAEVKDSKPEAEAASTRKPEPAAPAPNDRGKDDSEPGRDLANAAGHQGKANEAAAEAKPAEASKPAAVDLAAAESGVPAAGNPNPATMAVPRTGDIKATAALSRTEIDAHRAAAEHAKAEAESSFGARAEVAAADPEPASFWFALNHSRPVFHPVNGTMLATLNPGKWILCLEDRGTEYLINLAEGRPAVLRDLDDLQFPDK